MCHPYFIIQSQAQLLPPPTLKPLNRIMPIHVLYTDGWTVSIFCFWFSEEETPMPKTEWALSSSAQCLGFGQQFHSLLAKKKANQQLKDLCLTGTMHTSMLYL